MNAAARTVFLTGVTGAIGSVILRELLRDPSDRVSVLIRATDVAQAHQRLEKILTFLRLDGVSADAARIDVVCGDLSKPRFGLPSHVYDALAMSVTHLIHAAGNVKLNQTLDAARTDAVVSAQYVLDFADACLANGRFEKCDVVSTVGVCGRWKGLVPEAELPKPRTYRNTYEEAKAEAEDLVLAHIRSGFPATIHRPSMVVGDSMDGRALYFQVFYFLAEFLLGNRSWGILPRFGQVKLDIIGVDYVARAIVLSSRSAEAKGCIFHLCAGPGGALSMAEIGKRIRILATRHGRTLHALTFIDPSWIRRLLPVIRAFLPGKAGRALNAVPFLMSYLDDDQTFANASTNAFFGPRGLPLPSTEKTLDASMAYYFKAQEEKRRPR